MSPLSLITRSHCPWCSSSDTITLCEYPYAASPLSAHIRDAGDASFTVCECNTCHVLFQKYIYDQRNTTAFYESWNYSPAEPDFLVFYMQELLMLRSCFNRREQDISILDYGMGWGAFCEVAKTMNFSICGHDLSSIKRDHVRARGIRVINELSDLPPESLDFINLEQVIEHVAEPRALVQKLTSYLKTGGIMKISVPHQSAQMRYQLEHLLSIGSNNLYDKIMEIWPLSHINCFTRAALIRGLHNAALPVSMPLYPLFLPSALNAITSHFKTLYGRPLHEIHPGYLLRMSTRLLYKKYYPGSNYLFFKKIR